jgi:hypothetical protein
MMPTRLPIRRRARLTLEPRGPEEEVAAKRGPFDLDDEGNVKSSPLTGWDIVSVAGTALIARLKFADSFEEFQTGGRAVQLLLTPHVALDLAQELTKQAQRILGQTAPPGQAH